MRWADLQNRVGRERLTWGMSFLIGLAAVGIVFGLAEIRPTRFLELKLLDYRFQVRGDIPVDPRLVIISIGNEDLKVLGRWPWPREYHANLITVLSAFGAKVIGFDILFNLPDEKNPGSDKLLAEAMTPRPTESPPRSRPHNAQ